MIPAQRTSLFRFTCKIFKYGLLMLLGLGTICLLATVLGLADLAIALLNGSKPWLLRLSAIALYLVGIAIVFESLQ
jgi:hypothetical protein